MVLLRVGLSGSMAALLLLLLFRCSRRRCGENDFAIGRGVAVRAKGRKLIANPHSVILLRCHCSTERERDERALRLKLRHLLRHTKPYA